MKFWYAPHKDFTNREGRFVFEVGGSDNEEIQRIVSEADGGSFDYSLRSAENTFTIPDAELTEYQENWPNFVEQHNAVKQEQRELMVTFDESTAIKSEIMSERMAALDVRRDYERDNLNLREQQDGFSDEVTRLSPQFDPPESFIDFINQAVLDPETEISDDQIVNFVQAHGAQPGSLQFNRNVNVVSNNLARAQQLAQRQAELQRQEQAVLAQEAAVAERFDEFMDAEETLNQTTNRLSEIFQIDLPAIEREQATIEIQLMLAELQAQVDTDGDGIIDQLSPAEQVERLITLSQLETTTDAVSTEERNWREYLRDGVGFALESTVLSEAMANWARQRVDSDPKVQILNNMSESAVRMFVQNYPNQAMRLTTDMVGRDSFRIDFYGNSVLEGEVDLVDYFPTQPEFIEYNGQLAYLSTNDAGELVYKNADDHTIITPETNYVFTILNDTIEDHPELAEVLATQDQRALYWEAETLRGVNETLINASIEMMFSAYGVQDFTEFETKFNNQFGQFEFAQVAGGLYAEHISEIEEIKNNPTLDILEINQAIMAAQEQFQQDILNAFNQGHSQISESDLSTEEKDALISDLNQLRQILSPESRSEVMSMAQDRIDVRREEIVDNILREHFYHLSPERRAAIRSELLASRAHPNPEAITRAFLLEARSPDSDLRAEFMTLFQANITSGELQSILGRMDSASVQSDIVFSEAIQSFWDAPGLEQYQRDIRTALSEQNGVIPSSDQVAIWLTAISSVEIGPVGTPEMQALWQQGKIELTDRLEQLMVAARQNEEGAATVTAAEANQETTELAYERFLTPAGEIAREAARIDPTIADDPNFLAVFYDPETNMETLDVPGMIELIQSETYRNSPPDTQALLMAQTTAQPISINADAATLQSQYNFYLPPGVRYGNFTIDPSGETSGSFQSAETQFIIDNDGSIIAEHLTGVPDSEDLQVPPDEWATAQALGAMTESFVIKSAAELAQDVESLGNMALVNFMRQYWGIRGRDTLPESELDKFKSLGEMMSDNQINFQVVLAQLNALKWDETAAGNRALDVRHQFNEVLEAAAAGNNEGFRRLLRLDSLPAESITTELV